MMMSMVNTKLATPAPRSTDGSD